MTCMNTAAPVTYTHPDVLTTGVQEGWADPRTDPAHIDWPARQRAAALPFAVVNGRPLNPHAPTGIRYGRNELGHWGEQLAADAVVTATDADGSRWLAMVERRDGHGWALPAATWSPGKTRAARRSANWRKRPACDSTACSGRCWRPGTCPTPAPAMRRGW
ncbi:hypothetical protein Acor_83440 [Acrocarpospora corrugata]|uniref:Uncharacterized protein n=1 Tax=Acrocarpospora corrugata TaxID=35763 RepID=A0A5M3WB59_9ACTN|nr:hypothetical protein Acor_83440 [Acrocarpospora corrugata]